MEEDVRKSLAKIECSNSWHDIRVYEFRYVSETSQGTMLRIYIFVETPQNFS